ncbi:MAG: hypothetical protein ACFFFG_01495 [Candidatus Thorarchaeota archaeon]
MTRRILFFEKIDKIWVYSGLFGLSLLLHYLTPYYQQQQIPNFTRSVIIAPLFEEFIYRYLGILTAVYSTNKIAQGESIKTKIYWGMAFILSVYFEFGMSFLRIQNYLSSDCSFFTLIFSFIFLGVLLLFEDYKLGIIIVISSFNWALIHETFRILPVFIAGIFFSILCINQSRILLIKNQKRMRIIFLLIYGASIGYVIHFWNNLLNWALFQEYHPLFIDAISIIGVHLGLFLLQTFINQYIDKKFLFNHY